MMGQGMPMNNMGGMNNMGMGGMAMGMNTYQP